MPKHSTHVHGPLLKRFWPKVDCSDRDACWLWTGATVPKGYGKINDGKGSTVYAHRVIWEYCFGPIPPGKNILHRCDTPRCVNPDHLFLGTIAENNEDMRQKGRKWSKLKPSQIPDIKGALSLGWSVGLVASLYGVSKSTVQHIKKHRAWTYIN